MFDEVLLFLVKFCICGDPTLSELSLPSVVDLTDSSNETNRCLVSVCEEILKQALGSHGDVDSPSSDTNGGSTVWTVEGGTERTWAALRCLQHLRCVFYCIMIMETIVQRMESCIYFQIKTFALANGTIHYVKHMCYFLFTHEFKLLGNFNIWYMNMYVILKWY